MMWRGTQVLRSVLLAGAVAAAALSSPSAAADANVPVALQAQLIAKLAAFDRNMAARSGGTVKVVILEKPGDPESGRVANQLAKTMGNLPDIAGMPKDVQVVQFSAAAAVADLCKGQHVAIVYLTPGLDGDVGAIAGALSGVDVMSVGGDGNQVAAGAVIGFELDEGKPRIVVNLSHAKSQNVALKAEVLRLARIVG